MNGPERVTARAYRDTSPCAPCRGYVRTGEPRFGERKRPGGAYHHSCRFAWIELDVNAHPIMMLCPCCGPYEAKEIDLEAAKPLGVKRGD